MKSLFRLASLAVLFLIVVDSSAYAARRVALVIGNGAYQNTAALTNPPNDAHAMADKLKGMGFQVIEGYDLGKETLNGTVQQFARAVVGADIGLFYYAGHGMQVAGENYIVPVDARLSDDLSIDFEVTKVSLIINQMTRNVKTKIVLLDSCRDNPLSRSLANHSTRSNAVATGMAEMKIVNQNASEGSLIAFATDPDNVAEDGTGGHSPFTTALLENIDANASLSTIMNRVTSSVMKQTDNRQRPWQSVSLTGDIYLNPAVVSDAQSRAIVPVAADAPLAAAGNSPPVTAASAPVAAPGGDNAAILAGETALWDAVKQTNMMEDYESYLQKYPAGLYAGLAKNAIKRLSSQQAALTPPAGAVTSAAPPAATSAPVPVQQQTAALEPTPRSAPAMNAVVDVAQAEASPETELTLGLDLAAQKGIQQRLKLAGFYSGRADGNFGAGSRSALSKWQAARGVGPTGSTGYLNQPQYALLLSETDAAYNLWRQQNAAPPKPARPRVVYRQQGDGQVYRPRHSGGGDGGFGNAMGGFIAGAVLGGILSHR